MKSPLFPDTALLKQEIEPGLTSYVCPRSQGIWLPLPSYLAWRERRDSTAPVVASEEVPELSEAADRKPLFCPESGALLARYRVGHGLQFQIDRSPMTGGIWLDHGEWQALKSKGLHHELHRIFTAPYQRAIRNASYQDRLRESFQQRIGADSFAKVQAFRDWMAAHPHAADIRAFMLEREL